MKLPVFLSPLVSRGTTIEHRMRVMSTAGLETSITEEIPGQMVASMSFHRPRALDEWFSHYAHCHLFSRVKLKINMKKY